MRRMLLLATVACGSQQAVAQSTPRPDHHAPEARDIIVTAPFNRDRADVLSGTSVLTGVELTRDLRTTIGETLARQPGVSATSFGPNASRPVLRGFQGERVRILRDGIGSIDVSNTSVDHAVVINPLTADRIEVLRGTELLLFGSSAIGGVVNVIDSRIPRRVPDEALHFDALGTFGSASAERSGSAKIDLPIGRTIVFHVDGSYSKTRDLNTGGFILAAPLRATARASADPDINALADLRGRLPNTAARSWEVAAGAAFITDSANLGASFSHYDSLYGVPIRYSLDPGVEAEEVRLKIRQDRADVRGEVQTGGGFLQTVRLRAGIADYKHSEIDDTGAIGTTFLNKSVEGRLEFVQAQRKGLKGAFGAQVTVRDFDVIGDEAFVPKNITRQYGLFTLQTLDAGPVEFEAGARYEHSSLKADASETIGNPAYSRRFDAFSGSLGASYKVTNSIRIGVSASHTERAPAAEELFANGPHAGTQSFEIGNPDFRKERSNGVEVSLRGTGSGYGFSLAGYASWFRNYIYEQQTGAIEDDLPVFQFQQAGARYHGVEAEVSARVAKIGAFAINVDGVADYTRARIKGVGPVPRIPPFRLLGGIETQSDKVVARGEVEYSAAQKRVSPFETRTGGFTLVNASLAYLPMGRDSTTSIVLSANNIFDVEARRHASILKDFAPLSGRDIRVTGRIAF